MLVFLQYMKQVYDSCIREVGEFKDSDILDEDLKVKELFENIEKTLEIHIPVMIKDRRWISVSEKLNKVLTIVADKTKEVDSYYPIIFILQVFSTWDNEKLRVDTDCPYFKKVLDFNIECIFPAIREYKLINNIKFLSAKGYFASRYWYDN